VHNLNRCFAQLILLPQRVKLAIDLDLLHYLSVESPHLRSLSLLSGSEGDIIHVPKPDC